MRNRGVWAFIVAALLALSGGAAAEDAASTHAAQCEAVVARLREYAKWCEGSKLYRERNVALEGVLHFRPDDAEARQRLGWKRVAGGRWSRTRVPNPPSSDPALLPDAARRRTEAVAAFREHANALRSDPTIPIALRERALLDLISAAPDDTDARADNREVREGESWVLRETVDAALRRQSLKARIDEWMSQAKVPPRGNPTAAEMSLVEMIDDVRATADIRVVGGIGIAGDAATVTRLNTVARKVFDAITGARAPQTPGLRFFVFWRTADAYAAADRDARLEAADRQDMRRTAGKWVPGADDFYLWAQSQSYRQECALRQCYDLLVRRVFRVGAKRGWVSDGFGQWVSEMVLGTHESTFLARSDYAESASGSQLDLRRKLLGTKEDWLLLGARLEAGGRWPPLRDWLALDVNRLDGEHLLCSYLLARYLIEGRPETVNQLLKALGAGAGPDTWTAECLGGTVEGLEARLRRWVQETAARK